MIPSLEIDAFMRLARDRPVVDVRTPAEFEHGHIPGAINLPLFSDEERVQVGTTYKVTGKDAATMLGLDLVGPKMRGLVEDLDKRVQSGDVLLHCWRGGMRSQAVAWLLNFSGKFAALTLDGGYKSYRRWIRKAFADAWQLVVLGGMTGSGKTATLLELAALGEQVVDLEALACHRGSSYGGLWTDVFPTQEQFENDLGNSLQSLDRTKSVWAEDESRRIGRLFIPDPFFEQMSQSARVVLEIPRKGRVAFLVDEYGSADREQLIESTRRIERRLGGLETRTAVEAIERGDLATGCDIALAYYDKTYTYGLSRRDPTRVVRVNAEAVIPRANAEAVRLAARQNGLP